MAKITNATIIKQLREEVEALRKQNEHLFKENGELRGRLKVFEDCFGGVNKFCEDVGKSVGMFFSGQQK